MTLRNVDKTFSLEEQRQEINEIAVDLDAVNTTLTNWNASQWDTAYGWGDHGAVGYLTSIGDASGVTTAKITEWDTAYGWGDHAQAGYLTAYQTDAQIKTAYENNADTNAFTDAEQTKLTNIETSATADQTDVEIKTAYENNADTNAFTDALQTKLTNIETSATADQTDAEIKTAYENNADTNAFTDAEQTKLTGIADGAEVNILPGGIFSGTGTAEDPSIGSVQFKNQSNTFTGDALFVYNNTNNRLSIGANSGGSSLNVTTTTATSADTAYFYASADAANNRVRISTVANEGGHPYIKFDSGGSNMIVGQLWVGTTSNKLVLGVGEDPSDTVGITVDGNGNCTAKNLALSGQTNGSGLTSGVLDHYEEGTWTSTITSPSALSATSFVSGYYTKVGQLVYLEGEVTYTNTGNDIELGFTVEVPFLMASPSAKGSNFCGTSYWSASRGFGGVVANTGSNDTELWVMIHASQNDTGSSGTCKFNVSYHAV
jgi:hypothetical protein